MTVKAVPTSGSSPLARGAHGREPVALLGAGIIPACAGSTAACWVVRSGGRDHPRLRGEHVERLLLAVDAIGSSPLARGAHSVQRWERSRTRIIPACAGSTLTFSRSLYASRDHPRLRGEHYEVVAPQCREQGSSPLARGAPVFLAGLVLPSGIIPACAGSTRRWAFHTRFRWDHPRLRGEHATATICRS